MDGTLIVTAGASRSGKTLLTRTETTKAKRLLVWDPKGAWAREDHCQPVTSRRALLAAIKATRYTGPARLAFISPARSDFGFWASTAFWWCRAAAATVVAEETANVTNPAKAPDGWHLLLSQGLEFGATIHAITQRPAESDKTAIGNASIIRCFRCSRARDRAYMAAEMDCAVEKINALEQLEYWQKDHRTGELTGHKLKAPR